MTYSIDLRKKVVGFIEAGGSKVEASRIFNVGRKSIYNWLNNNTLSPKKHGERRRKIDKKALLEDVQKHPDKILRERAAAFGVRTSSMHNALKKLKISHKKSLALSRKKP